MALVACVQMCSGADVEANLARLDRLVERAASYGAIFVATPENTTMIAAPAVKLAAAEPLDGPTHQALAAIAHRHGVWLLVGSVAEAHPTRTDRYFNTSVLYDAAGRRLAAYRKIHRFDVDLPDGTRFEESASVEAGEDTVVVDTNIGRLGMSVCYDVRFPGLYAELVDKGATVLSVPSAFTVTTGRDHWHVLVRARAIESQCLVLAPAQTGAHGGGRVSYGHSLIVDAWGTVLAEAGEGEGLALAELATGRTVEVRRSMPVHAHRRR